MKIDKYLYIFSVINYQENINKNYSEILPHPKWLSSNRQRRKNVGREIERQIFYMLDVNYYWKTEQRCLKISTKELQYDLANQYLFYIEEKWVNLSQRYLCLICYQKYYSSHRKYRNILSTHKLKYDKVPIKEWSVLISNNMYEYGESNVKQNMSASERQVYTTHACILHKLIS